MDAQKGRMGWTRETDRMDERDGLKIWDGRYIRDRWINGSVSELMN